MPKAGRQTTEVHQGDTFFFGRIAVQPPRGTLIAWAIDGTPLRFDRRARAVYVVLDTPKRLTDDTLDE